MTDTEIIEKLAEFMGWQWKVCTNHSHGGYKTGMWTEGYDESKIENGDCFMFAKYGMVRARDWNPLKSWDHWRMVEEKIRNGDPVIWTKFVRSNEFIYLNTGDPIIARYVDTDLPTRCKILVSILSNDN